jgi:hypothetical protein
MRVGDRLEVIFAGNGRFNVYRRRGVFTEPGQFVFDGVLLMVETLLMGLGVRLMYQGLRRPEKAGVR